MEEDLTKKETIKEEQNKEDIIDLKESDEKIDKKSIKINKKTIIIVAIIVAVLVVFYLIKGFFVVATVNGNPISRLSLINKLEQQGGASVLDSIITEKLIENEARAKKIVISNEEINEEIKKVEDQVKAQGGTLEAILDSQGMTLNDVKKQITLQKQVEKLLSDKINVTDEEVAKYIKDNAITVESGQEEEVNIQVKSALTNEKLNIEAQAFINDLKTKAKIKYFVKY
ncbi:MAG TPA: SurA N-terminal domain-containing protein [bacterium]|nr:SurA N-terminal domain-containing protein [bacterium]